MSIASKTGTLFVLDCSASMNRPRPLVEGKGDQQRTRLVKPIDVAIQYTKAKVVQRLLRGLKTTPMGVLTYAAPKTKNILSTLAKQAAKDQNEEYDKDEDSYRYMYENVSEDKEMGKKILDALDQVEAGNGPDATPGSEWSADAHSALILALETLTRFRTKLNVLEIVLITDGESESDWDGWERFVERMNLKEVSLTVVGFNFDDEDYGYFEQEKSDIKRTNEQHLNSIVDNLTQDSVLATASHALAAIAAPVIREVSPNAVKMTLSLGDREDYPDQSISMQVCLKKATSAVAVKSMKKLSLRGYERASGSGGGGGGGGGASQFGSQSQRIVGRDSDAQSKEGKDDKGKTKIKYGMGDIGRTLDRMLREEGFKVPDEQDDNDVANLASHEVTANKRWMIEVAVPKESDGMDEDDEDGPTAGKSKDDEPETELVKREVMATPSNVYLYGGSFVPEDDMGSGRGTMTGHVTGMEICGFMKQSEIRYDWRMGDVNYVYAEPGRTGSEYLFSALINGMIERKAAAFVRYVPKTIGGRPAEPKMCLLYPKVEGPAQIEYCVMIRLPFAEDLRKLAFPSLERYFNSRGKAITESKLIPTNAMQDAMDNLVDSMDLGTAGEDDEDGQPTSWLNLRDAPSPAVHNVVNALVFRVSNPNGDLPPASGELTKYLEPPSSVLEASKASLKEAIKALDVKFVPPKPKKTNRKRAEQYEDQVSKENDIDLDDLLSGPTTFGGHSRKKRKMSEEPPAMEVDENNIKRSQSATLGVDDDDEEDGVMVDAPSGGRSATAPSGSKKPQAIVLDDDSDAEPDTEDEEDSKSFVVVPKSSTSNSTSANDGSAELDALVQRLGTEKGVSKFIEENVWSLIDKSFSTSKYDQACQALAKAKALANKKHATAAYDLALKSLVAKASSSSKKTDFVGYATKKGYM